MEMKETKGKNTTLEVSPRGAVTGTKEPMKKLDTITNHRLEMNGNV